MEAFATLLHWTGVLLYGGPLVAFAVMLPLTKLIKGVRPWHLDRVYRAWGSGFGLGLGAIFLGGLVRYFLSHGGFIWGVETIGERLTVAKHVVFLLLWVSYTILEIWTMEPLRKQDAGEGVLNEQAYMKARAHVVKHTALNAVLFLLVFVLGFASVSV